MKKRLLLPGSVLAVGGLVLLLLHWFNSRQEYLAPSSQEELARMAARLRPGPPTQPAVVSEPVLDPSRDVRLAIGWLGLPDEAQNGHLTDLLTAELGRAKGLALVDRQSRDKVLRELQLSLSGLVRAKEAVRVGTLLRADWFLMGSRTHAGVRNTLVARIVDARSGVIRELGVFPGDAPSPELAKRLAQFVRDYRQSASRTKPRVFLAFGILRDVSINSRQADFPVQLRAQLMQAYQGSGVTLLEREDVNALLEEVHLDMAGLTDGAPAALPTLQSAFWLVDGYYQSYETSGFEVELGLTIHRIFGGSTTAALRGKPGDELVRSVKARIDVALAAPATILAPTRASEARAQMEAGKQLVVTPAWSMHESFLLSNPPMGFGADDPQGARTRRNLEEAVRAFQTVLLLEPTNRAARIYLAAALRSAPLLREDEARGIYRELLAESVQDEWVGVAQQALLTSLRFASPEEQIRWLQPASSQTSNPSTTFFQQESSRVARDMTIQQGEPAQARTLAEAHLLETIAKFDAGRWYQESIGMDDFAATFGTDHAAAARRLVELYPKMKAQAPDSALFLLASIVSFQVDTNAPVIAQFQRDLNQWAEHPDPVPLRVVKFANHLDVVHRWGQKHKFDPFCNQILEAKQRARGVNPGAKPAEALAAALATGPGRGNVEAMRLAWSYKASHHWQEALQIFESYTNQPIEMDADGPWGRAFTIVLPSKEAAACRKELGLAAVRDPREFDLGSAVLCLHGTEGTYSSMGFTKFGVVAAAPDGLWLAYRGQLLHLDAGLNTNKVIELPISSNTPINRLCLTPTEVWIGTGGEGLVCCNITTRQCEHLPVASRENDTVGSDQILIRCLTAK